MIGSEASWRPRRPVWWFLATVVVILLVAAWLAVRGLVVQRHLASARDDLQQVRTAGEDGDRRSARSALAAAQRETARARSLTTDWAWATAGSLPWLGRSSRAVTTAAAVADEVTGSVLPPLVEAATAFDLSAVSRGDGIDLAAFAGVTERLREARTSLVHLRRRTDAVTGPLLWPVGAGVDDLRHELSDAIASVDVAARAATLAPPMLGEGGERTYLLAVQNPAEARGTGGLLGAYGIVVVRDGKVSMREIGPNSRLHGADRLPIDLGADFAALYGNDPALWVNANMSPYYPYAAAIWLRLWQQQFHEQLDGVLAIDPVVLGFLVGATSPVRLPDGTRLTGRTTADFVMSDVYRRYPSFAEDTERDRLLADIGAVVVRHILHRDIDSAKVLHAVRRGVQEGRVLLYSAHPEEQRRLAGTAISGAPSRTRAPRLEVVVNNGAANKLDYYLGRSVRWQLGGCKDGRRRVRVTVTVGNPAPVAGLPAYVLGNRDLPRDGAAIPQGTNRLLVSVFSTAGSRLVGGELDHAQLRVRRGLERGQTVTAFTVDLAPGQRRTAVLDLVEPARPEAPVLVVQPLVRPQRSVTEGARCDGNGHIRVTLR